MVEGCGEGIVSTPRRGKSFNTEGTEENTKGTEDIGGRA